MPLLQQTFIQHKIMHIHLFGKQLPAGLYPLPKKLLVFYAADATQSQVADKVTDSFWKS